MSIRIRQYNRKMRYGFLGALVALLGAGGLLTLTNHTVAAEESTASQSSASRIVTIYDNGQRQSAMTKAATVRQALKEAKVTFDEQRDVVEPALDTKISNNDFQINLYRARVVTIVEKSHRVRITTTAQSPAQIAQAAGVTLYKEDEVQFSPPDDIALDGASILMKITRAPQRTVTTEEEIDFPVEQERDASKPIGYRDVKQAGEKGLRKLTYQVDVLDGAETARHQIANEVIKQPKTQIEIVGSKPSNPLTKSKGAHIFTDSKGVAHRETYYDLPMNVVIKACGGGDYTVREDGAKVDEDGYILVAANYGNYPRCSVVETSMGPGKVYDTGGFAARHPHGFDLATDWTNGDGR